MATIKVHNVTSQDIRTSLTNNVQPYWKQWQQNYYLEDEVSPSSLPFHSYVYVKKQHDSISVHYHQKRRESPPPAHEQISKYEQILKSIKQKTVQLYIYIYDITLYNYQ